MGRIPISILYLYSFFIHVGQTEWSGSMMHDEVDKNSSSFLECFVLSSRIFRSLFRITLYLALTFKSLQSHCCFALSFGLLYKAHTHDEWLCWQRYIYKAVVVVSGP
jgi:hypothetical protein